ncbi:Transposon-encoded protein TnpV [Selenomonas ruminantium]|uniref:Transposon-encoded protein TnpV n=2 Tax=Selenomonas ruminantium TaxID=971 RepID=A0A1I3EQ76_SELRU|nr:Transposon-encoded protein TnpV [Selenomonas ruminantium]
MYMTDEELLAKNYGFWGNAHRKFMYEYRSPDWELLQDAGKLESYFMEMNDKFTRKERKMLDNALRRSGMMAALKDQDANEWTPRYIRVREAIRKLLLKEVGY